jgi:protein TonB
MDEDDGRKPAWMRWGGVALGLAAAVLLALWLRGVLMSGKPSKPMKLQQITLVRPPPPPPPKPPEQKPPEPEVKEEVKLDEQPPTPEPQQADAPPPGPDLAGDAVGGAGGDGFGLLGKKGGSDLIGGGGGGNRFAWYGAMVKERIQERVQEMAARERKLREADFRIMVNVWISATGAVTRVELLESTGNAELDNALKVSLRGLPPLREGAPGDMPQPIKLRITAR